MKLFWKLFGPALETLREKREARMYRRLLVELTISQAALDRFRLRMEQDDLDRRQEDQ